MQKSVTFMLLLYFLIFLGFNLFYTAFPNHAARGLNWSVTDIGVFFTVLSSVMVFVQGPMLARISASVRPPILVIAGGAVLGTGFLVLTSSNMGLIYIGAVFFALGNGLMWPSFMALLSKVGSDTHQGVVQGLAASAGSLASIMGLILGGFAYNAIGQMTFVVSAGIIFLCSLVSIRLISAFPPTTSGAVSLEGSPS